MCRYILPVRWSEYPPSLVNTSLHEIYILCIPKNISSIDLWLPPHMRVYLLAWGLYSLNTHSYWFYSVYYLMLWGLYPLNPHSYWFYSVYYLMLWGLYYLNIHSCWLYSVYYLLLWGLYSLKPTPIGSILCITSCYEVCTLWIPTHDRTALCIPLPWDACTPFSEHTYSLFTSLYVSI